MIIAVDTETQGLNCEAYLYGCIVYEDYSYEVFNKKEEMWSRILEIGEKQKKYNKKLTVYAHNHEYDYYTYANYLDPNMNLYSTRPFIGSYGKKEHICFYDTINLYGMSLEEVGKLVGVKKGETPEKLKKNEPQVYSKDEENEIIKYMVLDACIVMKGIHKLKKKLNEEGIPVRRLITISQLAINDHNNRIRKIEGIEGQWRDKNKREYTWTTHKKMIKEAYRGGRIEARKKGYYEKTTQIDINSLYSWAAMNIPYPNLESEMLIEEPERITNRCGVSCCIIQSPKKKHLGVLPVRQETEGDEENTYPETPGALLCGTWTNIEILKAIEEGYEILHILWSINYQETINPYKNTMPELYAKRRENKEDNYNSWFYKQLMNRSFGKLGQDRMNQEIQVGGTEELDQRNKEGWNAIAVIGKEYVYRRETRGRYKPYYAPIIPTLINAVARIKLYEDLKKVGLESILYMDTDSILIDNKKTSLEKIKKKYVIGSEMGEYKIESTGEEARIYAKKIYVVGDKIKLSGVPKAYLGGKGRETTKIEYKRMIGIKEAREGKRAGTFNDEKIDLEEAQIKSVEKDKSTKNKKIYIDEGTQYVVEIGELLIKQPWYN